MNDSIRLQDKVTKLWTSADLALMFGRTTMTILNWRKDRALPTITIPGNSRPSVRFVPRDVIAWAQANKVEIRQTLTN